MFFYFMLMSKLYDKNTNYKFTFFQVIQSYILKYLIQYKKKNIYYVLIGVIN